MILAVWALVIIGGGAFFVWTAFAGINTADYAPVPWVMKAIAVFSVGIDIMLIYAIFSKNPKLRANRTKHILQFILFSGVVGVMCSKIL